MLEFEIKKLTDAIEALTVEIRLAKVGNELPTETPVEKSHREDDAYREGLQAARDKAVEDKAPKKSSPKKAAALILDNEPAQEPKKEVEAEPSDITADTLKTVAMEIARADSSARSKILEILDEHGAKTITQLDPKHYGSVHHKFLKMAKDIFDKSEAV
jgi:hypothetical protein